MAINDVKKIESFILKTAEGILDLEANSIEGSHSFYDLGGTSIDMYDLITELEDEYSIEIDQGATQKFKTFEEIAEYLSEQMSA